MKNKTKKVYITNVVSRAVFCFPFANSKLDLMDCGNAAQKDKSRALTWK